MIKGRVRAVDEKPRTGRREFDVCEFVMHTLVSCFRVLMLPLLFA